MYIYPPGAVSCHARRLAQQLAVKCPGLKGAASSDGARSLVCALRDPDVGIHL